MKLCIGGHPVKLKEGLLKLGDERVLRDKKEKENTACFLSFGPSLNNTHMNMQGWPRAGKRHQIGRGQKGEVGGRVNTK